MRDKYIFIVAGIVAVVIGVLLSLSGVGNPTPPVVVKSETSAMTATIVPFTKIVQGQKSSISERANFLITSPEQLKELWKLIDATTTQPVVDFKRQSVIAVFAGKQSTSSIAIAKIEDTNARLVSIAIAKPDTACAQEASAASAYEVVIVPSTTLSLSHQDIPTTTPCR